MQTIPSTQPLPPAEAQNAKARNTVPADFKGPVLLVAPHPDDETLGAGGFLSAAAARGQAAWVVFVTCGDAFPWGTHRLRRWHGGYHEAQQYLARKRIREALTATARLGIPPERVVFLGFPDRGISDLAGRHYDTPYRSPATGVDHVPYASAHRPGAPYTGRELVMQLRDVVRRAQPGVILTPGPLDSHADHCATTQLVHAAVRDLHAHLVYYLVHSSADWPSPKGYRPDRTHAPPRAYGPTNAWMSHALSAEQIRLKRDAIRAYGTQVSVMGWLLWSYLRSNELLLPAHAAPPGALAGGRHA